MHDLCYLNQKLDLKLNETKAILSVFKLAKLSFIIIQLFLFNKL